MDSGAQRIVPFVSFRGAIVCTALGLGSSGCALLEQTVRHEVSWQPAVFSEVSRAPGGVELLYEQVDGQQWVTAIEHSSCIEEATQTGVEVEERKPKDWVLTATAFLGGGATAAGIGLLGGALTSGLTNEARTGQQSVAGQVVGTAVGIAGTVAQLLLYKKIVEGLNAIHQERTRPVRQELGRQVPCDVKVLFRLRVAN
jgi:hypothetical protein